MTPKAAILLTFTSPTVGTFTYTADYVEQYDDGPLDGVLAGSGVFSLISPTSDDFSLPLSPAIWELYDSSDLASFVVANGKLNFVSPPDGGFYNYAQLAYTGAVASYDQSWDAIIDLSNLTPESITSGLGMDVHPGVPDYERYVFVELGNDIVGEEESPEIAFFSNVRNESDTDELPDSVMPSEPKSGSIRISFDSATKVLSTYADRTGSSDGYQWELLGTFGINGAGGTRNQQWGMNQGDFFTISLYGYYLSDSVGSGLLTFDNFRFMRPAPQSSAFSQWIGTAGLDGPNASPNAIPFSDGVPNLLKYAFNLDGAAADTRVLPLSHNATSGLPLTSVNEADQSPALAIEFLRRKGNPGITYQAEFSTDMLATESWENATNPETTYFIDETWERVRVEDHAPPGHASRFARVRVVEE